MDFPCIVKRQLQVDIARPKIPRPANAFMLYANGNRKKMARAFPLDSNKEISKRLGKGWKELDQEEKSIYFAMAKKVDAEHKKKYPDYVYNPKEARIRKAMRDASRERAMGVAPSSRSGRRSQPWVLPEPEDQFMMTPSHSMRGMVGSPMCGNGFPIGNVGSTPFMQPMHNYNKHVHMISPDVGYLQSNPMAQLQHQADMWHQYHQTPMRSNQTEQFMMPSSQISSYHHPQPSELASTTPPANTEKVKVTAETFPLPETSVSPHTTNENIPPNRLTMPDDGFDNKSEALLESSELRSQNDTYMNVYPENIVVQNPFDKSDNITMKKQTSSISNFIKPQKSLPDFNEAFGSTERGRFQSPPDPRLPPKQGYVDYFLANNDIKFEDYHI